jgi:hypothetical protein
VIDTALAVAVLSGARFDRDSGLALTLNQLTPATSFYVLAVRRWRESALLNRDALGQVSWLIHVAAATYGDVIGE